MLRNTVGFTTLALLVSKAEAVKTEFRPPTGSVPWHLPITRPSWESPPYPVNYKV